MQIFSSCSVKSAQFPSRKNRNTGGHLLPGPSIAGYHIQHSNEDHFITINQRNVRCSRDEYRLLLRLFEAYERPVPFDELMAQFCDPLPVTDPPLLKAARRKLTYTLSVLRSKLLATDFTIVRVVDVGYLLTQQAKLWSLAHPDTEEKEERF